MPNALSTYVLLAVAILGLLFGVVLFRSEEVSFLFVQTGESGTFLPAEDGDDSRFTLTIENASPSTIYYSDRPARIAGTLSNEHIVSDEKLFDASNPPNAAIVLHDWENDDEDVVIVALHSAYFDADQQMLIYEAEVLQESRSQQLAIWQNSADHALPTQFRHVSLFIDSKKCSESLVLMGSICKP